jgi:hypothetical protein
VKGACGDWRGDQEPLVLTTVHDGVVRPHVAGLCLPATRDGGSALVVAGQSRRRDPDKDGGGRRRR